MPHPRDHTAQALGLERCDDPTLAMRRRNSKPRTWAHIWRCATGSEGQTMNPAGVIESTVEEATLTWLEELGYTVVNGPTIAPGEMFAERIGYSDIFLLQRLRDALTRINASVPGEALDEAIRKITHPETASLIENNRRFHQMLVDGIEVEYRRQDGSIAGDRVFVIDDTELGNNDWLAVNQFTIIEDGRNRRADIIVFINGLPLAVIELKNPGDENTTVKGAFNQLQTYKRDIPSLFTYNELLVVSDGLKARAGTLTADWERFMPWRTVGGDAVAPIGSLELDVLIKGIFEKNRFVDLINNFVVFEDEDKLVKKMAGYHQFLALNKTRPGQDPL